MKRARASLCILCFLFPIFAYGQGDESKVKAQWIHTIIPYIKWENKTFSGLTICTLGQDRVGSNLIDIISKEIAAPKQKGSHMIHLNVHEESAKSDFQNCHVLYISMSERDNINNLLEKLHEKPILTISSISGFSDKGGMIEFVIKDDGVVLRINQRPTVESHIIIDSDLLGFAQTINK